MKTEDSTLRPGVNPGSGYRFLEPGEEIREGDEVVFSSGRTETIVPDNLLVRAKVSSKTRGEWPRGYYRRKVNIPGMKGYRPTGGRNASVLREWLREFVVRTRAAL